MATFLDIGLFNYFSVIFPALLVFAIVWALLQKTKVIGENVSINALIAIIAAFMILLSPDLADIINTMTPWFVLIFIFAVLLILIYMFLGASAEDLQKYITTDKPAKWFIFGLGAIIIIASIAHVYGQRALSITTTTNQTVTVDGQIISASSNSFAQNLGNVLFNSKILGLILIFLIAVFTLALLTRERF